MRIPRIYHPNRLHAHSEIDLSADAAHHVGRVLRMHTGDPLQLFDGSNQVFTGYILNADKKRIRVCVGQGSNESKESPLVLHLGQVISRGEKMEFTIQKSTELGINVITPLLSERCGVKLDNQRLDKKVQQWQKIAITACEQCGRNRVPTIRPVMELDAWCQEQDNSLKLNLHPQATQRISDLPENTHDVRLLIGPEGGLSPQEINTVNNHQFIDILLGPRILRTETAALTTITALQTRFGDLG